MTRKERTAGLHAGAAMVDITPRAGTHLAGDGAGRHRPAEIVLDPLHAKAVVFAGGGRKVCVLALDATIVTEEWTDRIRAAAVDLGFAPEAVMVHATQTHSAPTIGHMMFDPDFPDLPADLEYLRGGETRYYEFAVERAIEAVRRADATLRRVRLGVGRAVRDDLAFNRRGVRRDGRVAMPWFYSAEQKPLGPVELSHIEGPVDPEVGVLCARDEDGTAVAVLLHHTCHPVNVFATQKRAVSADWPGAWGAGVQESLGPECVPLVLNGCCGNINPWPAFTPDFRPDYRRMGCALAESARAVIERMEFTDANAVDWRSRRVPLPLKPPDPTRLDFARDMLARHPRPLWSEKDPGVIDPAWFRAASIMSVELMRKRAPELPYEVQALRIGDAALVGLPGEPFVEGQLAIKLASPSAFTFVAHATTQYVGYVPTVAAHARGGHEVDLSYWAKLAPEALDVIVREAVELLNAMFAGGET